MKTVTLEVKGMHCGGCVQAVRDALASVPGTKVEEIKVGTATVAIDDATSIASLIDAVDDAGYEAREAAA
jgi:copper chaperone